MTLQRYLTRLVWACTLPVLALAAAFALSLLDEQRSALRNEAQGLFESARSVADDLLRTRLAGLQTLASSPRADDPRQWPAMLIEAHGFLAAFDNHVALIDPQRGTQWHTMVPFGQQPPPAPMPGGRSAVQLALELAAPAVGDRFEGTVAQEPLVGLAAPVLRNGSVSYVIGSVIPVRKLQQRMSLLPIPPGWSLTLTDSQGQRLVHLGDHSDPANADDDLLVQGRLNVVPWTLEVRALQELSAHGNHRTALLLVVLLLGTLAIAVSAGRLASRKLSRSVQSLSRAEGAAASDIDEIRAARQTIDAAFAERDRAESERWRSETGFREQLERSAEDLRLREAQLRSILDSASDAIIVTDPELRIVMANDAAARSFGIVDRPVPGMALEQLFPKLLRATQCRAIEALTRADALGPDAATRPHMDLVGLRSDGSEFPIEAAVSSVRGNGTPLVTVILRDVTEARRLQAELRSLMAEHHRIEDNERRRIARELHDELQQVMVAIKMDVAAMQYEASAHAERLAPMLQRIDQLASTAVSSTRRIVNDLRPLMLEELGLVPALEALCQQFEQRTGIRASVVAKALPRDTPDLPERVEICLYRVAQESLNNVAKHSGASQVGIRLSAQPDGTLTMQVQDNGRGLPAGAQVATLSYGLKGMRERVIALGGTLQIANVAEETHGGAIVTVSIPLPPADAAA
jgi:PAS domain S-box-containing protein